MHESLQAAKTRQGALALLRTLLATQMIRSPRHRRLNPPRCQGLSAFHSMLNQIFPRRWCLLSVWSLKMFECRPFGRWRMSWFEQWKSPILPWGLTAWSSWGPVVSCIWSGHLQVRSVRCFGKINFRVFVTKGPSQVITCYHEHSLHLQMCSAAVLLCKVQATLGKSKCTFCRISISFNFHLGRNISSYLTNPVMRSCTAHTALESQLPNPG